MKKAVLWDLDGTLVDSEECHWRAWRETMLAEGIEIARSQFAETFGRRNDSFLPAWLGPDASADRIRRVGENKEARFRRLIREAGLLPLPGAAEWVERLRGRGWLQAVATSAPRANLDAMLRSLDMDSAFDATVSAEDVTHGKPNPEVFLAAASKLGIEPRRCIVVEDAPAGIEAARSAGMRVIGVSRGTELAADLFTRSLANLPADTFDRVMNGASQPSA